MSTEYLRYLPQISPRSISLFIFLDNSTLCKISLELCSNKTKGVTCTFPFGLVFQTSSYFFTSPGVVWSPQSLWFAVQGKVGLVGTVYFKWYWRQTTTSLHCMTIASYENIKDWIYERSVWLLSDSWTKFSGNFLQMSYLLLVEHHRSDDDWFLEKSFLTSILYNFAKPTSWLFDYSQYALGGCPI